VNKGKKGYQNTNKKKTLRQKKGRMYLDKKGEKRHKSTAREEKKKRPKRIWAKTCHALTLIKEKN